MKKNLYLILLFVLPSLSAFAQLQIDKSIDLTGSGSDARIMGIKSVADPEDAANASSVQTGALIYDDATGSGGNYLVTLSPAPTAYTTGMIVNFKANHSNSGAATLQVNGLTPAKSIKVGVTNDLASGDIAANQMVSVIYDGTNFQLLSRGSNVTIPTTLPPSGAAGGDLTGTYPNPDIAANAVTTNEIANGTIVTADLAANSVTSNEIVNGTIVTADLAANSVTSNEIVNGTIVTADLAANSVTSNEIVNGTIVTADLAANSVTTNEIVNGTIATADIATGAVTSNEIANATITAADLATTGVTAGGPYNNVTVNAQGQVTGASNVAYLTGNQNITLSGDVTGSGTTAITTNVGRINGATLGTTTATGGNLLIGSGSQWVSTGVSGDATLSSAGVLTLNQNNNGYIRNSAVGGNFGMGQSASYDITGNAEIGGTLNVNGNVGIGTLSPAKKLEVNGDVFTQGKLFQNTSAGQGSGAHGISWYRNDYVTWYDYMSNSGGTAAPNGTAAPTDASAGVTTWSRRFNIENAGTYGWLFESGPNDGTAPTVKFAINAGSGTFHSTGSGYIDGSVGIGTAAPAKKLEVNGDVYTRGKLLQNTSAGQGSGAHGISWYDNSFVTWYDYMSPNGGTNAPNGAAAPADATAGVTSWARRFNIENIGTYGWLFESGPNTGTAPTVKFGINAADGTFHSTGHGYVDGNFQTGLNLQVNGSGTVNGNLQVNGSAYWGSSLTRTETRDNAGLQGNAGARSGYFETSAPSPTANWYTGASGWQHLLDVRHSNNGNNYAMQFAGSFFDQRLYFRKTNNNPAAAWSEVMMTSMRRTETYHTFNIPGYVTSSPYYAWIPNPGGEVQDDVGSTVAQPFHRNCSWAAPAGGRLVRLVLHTEDQNSNGSHEIRGRVSIAVNGSIATYSGVTFNLDQNQTAVIDIPLTEAGFSFNAGDLINVGLNVSDYSGCSGGECYIEDNDYFVSCVWLYNY